MVVEPISSSSSSSSSIPIQPLFQDRQVEYVPDPEHHQQHPTQQQQQQQPDTQPLSASNPATTPTNDEPLPSSAITSNAQSSLSTTQSHPNLLLKIRSSSITRVSLEFELEGELLDSVRPRPGGGAQTGSSPVAAESNLNPDKDVPNPRYHHHPLLQDTTRVPVTTEHVGLTKKGLRSSRSSNAPLRSTLNSAGSMTSPSTTTGTEDYVFVSVRPRVTSMPTPDKRTLPNSGESSVYGPIIYFAETRTERHMHDLCRSEVAFQQQVRLTIQNKGTERPIFSFLFLRDKLRQPCECDNMLIQKTILCEMTSAGPEPRNHHNGCAESTPSWRKAGLDPLPLR